MRNLIERAVWTGIQSGLALLTIDGLFDIGAAPLEMLAVAGTATVISALKTFSQERLYLLDGNG